MRVALVHGCGAWIRGALVFAPFWALFGVTPAAAFSSSDRFLLAAADGGGGESVYTGSPPSRFNCTACHTGGEEAEWSIEGLPEDGRYEAGKRYDLILRWPAPAPSTAAALEFLSSSGVSAGELALPNPSDDLPEDRNSFLCPGNGSDGADGSDEGDEDRVPARILSLGNRNVVAMDGCGASALALNWTAPSQELEPVSLYAVLVSGNNNESFDGDDFADQVEVFLPEASDAPTDLGGSCSLSGATQAARSLACFVGFSLLFFRRSAQKTTRRRTLDERG